MDRRRFINTLALLGTPLAVETQQAGSLEAQA
jgi:hypothetical protein